MLIASAFECGSNCRQRLAALFRSMEWVGACVISVAVFASVTEAQILRVVTYNIEAGNGIDSNLTTVLQAIGNSHLAGNAQPIDVLVLQELATSPTTTTLPFIISQLNTIYGAGTYA